MKIYQFHIPQSQIAEIDELVREGEYPNRSAFVQEVINEKLERSNGKDLKGDLSKREPAEEIARKLNLSKREQNMEELRALFDRIDELDTASLKVLLGYLKEAIHERDPSYDPNRYEG